MQNLVRKNRLDDISLLEETDYIVKYKRFCVIAYALLERAYNAHSHTFVRHPMLTTASDDGDVAANDYF
jgi:hypothetical protein